MQDWNLTDKSAGLENDGQKSIREKLLDGGLTPPHTLPLPLHYVFFFTYPFSAGYITVFKILFRLRLPLASWVG